ncbi:MAG: hypothetical protein AMXMBFR64_58030 [Myxococcales bacterium]
MDLVVVIDTNVLVAGLKSSRGASHGVLQCLGDGAFALALSVPLVLEYEAVLLRGSLELNLSTTDFASVLDYLCSVGRAQAIFYLWRPLLRDPKDDMVLEVAVAAGGVPIVTFNKRDFRGAEKFAVPLWTPQELLAQLEVRP